MPRGARFGGHHEHPSAVVDREPERHGRRPSRPRTGRGQEQDREGRLADNALIGAKLADHVLVVGQELLVGRHVGHGTSIVARRNSPYPVRRSPRPSRRVPQGPHPAPQPAGARHAPESNGGAPEKPAAVRNHLGFGTQESGISTAGIWTSGLGAGPGGVDGVEQGRAARGALRSRRAYRVALIRADCVLGAALPVGHLLSGRVAARGCSG